MYIFETFHTDFKLYTKALMYLSKLQRNQMLFVAISFCNSG